MADTKHLIPDIQNDQTSISDALVSIASGGVTHIYALVDPRTGDVRYVGKSNDVNRRLRRHLKDARDGVTDHKSRWLASVLRDGVRPEIVILETCNIDLWKDRERYWIAHYRGLVDLCNAKDGGDGLDVDDATRAKMSAARIGKAPHNKGKQTPPDIRLKQSASAKRRWARMTESEREAYIEKYRGRPASGQALKSGWSHTDEARAKIAAASRARGCLSPEQVKDIRQQLSVGVRGRVLAAKYGVHEATISGIKHGRIYANEVVA